MAANVGGLRASSRTKWFQGHALRVFQEKSSPGSASYSPTHIDHRSALIDAFIYPVVFFLKKP